MSKQPQARRLVLAAAFASLAVNALLVLFQPQTALTEDLGRHLLLGKIIWSAGAVPSTNLLSFTHPDFPFVNHHWLSEVLMHLVHDAFGLHALMLLKVLVIGSALVASFWAAVVLAGPVPALASATLLLPLMLERNSERPEMFAYLLFSITYLLFFVREPRTGLAAAEREPWRRRVDWALCAMAVVVMLLWVNLHISFIYALLLAGVFLLRNAIGPESAHEGRRRGLATSLVLVVVLPAVASINPNGLTGATYPLTVFSNFGYETVENVGVMQLRRVLGQDPVIPYFLVCAAALAAPLVVALASGRLPWRWHYLLLLAFTAAVFLKIRNMPYFALVGIPVGAAAWAAARARMKPSSGETPARGSSAGLILLLAANLGLGTLLLRYSPPSLAVNDPWKRAFDYLEVVEPRANIFNNFDIGSYLEYRLYPRYRSFVDNRPEAFPKDFFPEYIRAQLDPTFRDSLFARYEINTIVVSRTDMTEWGRRFQDTIRADPRWKTSYADEYVLILEKNRAGNPGHRTLGASSLPARDHETRR